MGLLDLAVAGVDAGDAAGDAGGEGDDLVADIEGAAGEASCEAAEVVVFVGLGADDPLDWEACFVLGFASVDVDGFEVVEECGALIPGCIGGGFDDVVAVECADGDEGDAGVVFEAFGEVGEGGDDVVVGVFAPVDEVHFVDGDEDVLDA